MVFVNNYMRRAFLGSPFGGMKSGFGRENAAETLYEFVRSKNVRFPSGRGEIPTWPRATRAAGCSYTCMNGRSRRQRQAVAIYP